jgi:hypothetical protein
MVKDKELRIGGETVWRGFMYDPTLAQGDYTSKDLWKVFVEGGRYTLNNPLVRFHSAIYLDQPIPTNMTGPLPVNGAMRERFIHGVSGNSSSVLQLTSFGPNDKNWKDSNPSHWVMASILSSSFQPRKGYQSIELDANSAPLFLSNSEIVWWYFTCAIWPRSCPRLL